jgi:hypothetical protein
MVTLRFKLRDEAADLGLGFLASAFQIANDQAQTEERYADGDDKSRHI